MHNTNIASLRGFGRGLVSLLYISIPHEGIQYRFFKLKIWYTIIKIQSNQNSIREVINDVCYAISISRLLFSRIDRTANPNIIPPPNSRQTGTWMTSRRTGPCRRMRWRHRARTWWGRCSPGSESWSGTRLGMESCCFEVAVLCLQ
jgi:hypothetical protein